jgi:hypothetical protein
MNTAMNSAMNDRNALPKLGTPPGDPVGELIKRRFAVVSFLEESLKLSSTALARNDAEAIARGAAHQAELCLQWGRLEDQLRQTQQQRTWPGTSASDSPEQNAARLQAEWEVLGSRIRYLTRVHWSLLRHLERSLAVVNRVVNSCSVTYALDPCMRDSTVRQAGESPWQG